MRASLAPPTPATLAAPLAARPPAVSGIRPRVSPASLLGALTVALLVVPLLAYAAIYVQHAWALVNFPLDLDQGEGFDAWSGWLINLGQLPYSHAESFPYYSHGYPPVWSYLVSIPMAWFGPGLASARAVSAAIGVMAAVLIGRAAWRLSGSHWGGVLAAGFFLASPYVFHTVSLARVNGAVLLFGLLALTFSEKATRWRAAGVILALLLALFTKPTAFDAATAALGALLIARPRLGAITTMALAALGLVCLGGLEWASGGTYLLNTVLSNSSVFDGNQFVGYLGNFVLVHAPLLALAAFEAAYRVRHRAWSPWLLYLPASAVVTLATVGKTGAGESYFLPVIAAACVLAACAVVRWWPALAASLAWRRAALGAVVLLAQFALFSHGPLSALLPDQGFQSEILGNVPSGASLVAAQDLIRQVAATKGPVLAEDASVAVAAGKPIVGATPPSLRNLYHAGLWDPSPLVADIGNRQFAMIVLDAQMYPEPVLQAIGRYYFEARVVQVGAVRYHVMLPGTN